MVNEDKIPEANSDGPVELESQFLIRLPGVPAASLKATVASGVSLKDRLTIQLEPDLRHGRVRFDGWSLPAKVLDLPTIIECHKTLDKKTFYKTADICQMMVCREDVDVDLEAETDAKKQKDAKKFLCLHGVTPPMKNVRKKRFRKTLKKKFVDVPEIEKEVKRLFRMDAEAVDVRYEICYADDEGREKAGPSTSTTRDADALHNNNSHSNLDIAEHDLFGEIVSSSDEEDTRPRRRDESSDDSESANFPSSSQQKESSSSQLPTEFSREMIVEKDGHEETSNSMAAAFDMSTESTNAAAAVAALEAESAVSDNESEGLVMKLKELEQEIRELQNKRRSQEQEVSGIENLALRNRFQSLINSYKEQEAEKQRQFDDIYSILNPWSNGIHD